jgi:LPS sulfotransferase NodH
MIREQAFSRNPNLERLLKEINSTLRACEQRAYARFDGSSQPLILLMGPLRSGTTLLLQWLANTGIFCYPTNLLSRFYGAPIIGAKIQLMLTDPRYNYRNELGEFVQQATYVSENGKTEGALAPNEFWYFWRRFLPNAERDVWSDEELRSGMDHQTMLKEIAGVTDVFQKPFAAKGMLFNYNIPFLDSIIDNVLFIHIKRDPVSNVASVLDARKRQLGSEERWYSFKIPEYDRLSRLDPIRQAVGQVLCINSAVSKGLSKVAGQRKMSVDYQTFCTDPAAVYDEIVQKISLQNPPVYSGPNRFEVSRRRSDPRNREIEAALAELSEEHSEGEP